MEKEISFLNLGELHHRTKDRVRDLGEVFTPEKYVEDMLDLLSKGKRGFWADEQISFFEPCCGHGNIVIPIYKRRLDGIYKKALSEYGKDAPYYAVANAINTLWAIDIDCENVEHCRTRVFAVTLNFLRDKIGPQSDSLLFSRKKDFLAHILSAVKWQIDENETLSALSNESEAKLNSRKTKFGAKWVEMHGHHPINFQETWAEFYLECEEKDTVPVEYKRAIRFIDGILSGNSRGYDDFSFAKILISPQKGKSSSTKELDRALVIGA
jgi:hypothetical protein